MTGRSKRALTGYQELLGDILLNGHDVPSRLGPTREVEGAAYAFRAGDRVYRAGMAHRLGFVELLQLLAGTWNREQLLRAAPKANPSFFTPIGAYGPRCEGQLKDVVHLLTSDPTSRRAIVVLPERHELEVPCTLSLHFLVRGEALNLHVAMRSWDAWHGLPYDMIVFGGVLMAMASALRLEAGLVHVYASSLHLYEDARQRLVDEGPELAKASVPFELDPLQIYPKGAEDWPAISRWYGVVNWARLELGQLESWSGEPSGLRRVVPSTVPM